MLNNSGPRAKRSKLERTINIDILFQVLILVVLCLIGAIGVFCVLCGMMVCGLCGLCGCGCGKVSLLFSLLFQLMGYGRLSWWI